MQLGASVGGCDTRGGFALKFGTLGERGEEESRRDATAVPSAKADPTLGPRTGYSVEKERGPLSLRGAVRARDARPSESVGILAENEHYFSADPLRAARHGRAPKRRAGVVGPGVRREAIYGRVGSDLVVA